jgi:hypothetical protein
MGHCPVCNNDNALLYDTSEQDALTSIFEDLINVYTPFEEISNASPEDSKLLAEDINSRWHIFAEIPNAKIDEILKAICSDLYAGSPELFEKPVAIQELYDDSFLKTNALLKNDDWESFAREIKTKNRYHSKLINFEFLEKYCSYIRKTYKVGDEFYRARISSKDGYPLDEMSAPPAGKSSDGRVNARGVVCLYLASDIETALHEVRAEVFDFVSVGTFKLKQDITLVNLRELPNISPFFEGVDCVNYAINKKYLEILDDEISKPLRRSDSTLDYVPIQYIVDFIKSIEHDGKCEYDGIEYKSTTYSDGYNFAIFDPDLFECIDVKVFDIKKLEYEKEEVN